MSALHPQYFAFLLLILIAQVTAGAELKGTPWGLVLQMGPGCLREGLEIVQMSLS